MFRDATSSHALKRFTCASCAESILESDQVNISSAEFNINLLKCPDVRNDEYAFHTSHKWLDENVQFHPPMSSIAGCDPDVLVDPKGVCPGVGDKESIFRFCKQCAASLKRNKIPPLALANRLYIGEVPPELADLSIVEETMIARC